MPARLAGALLPPWALLLPLGWGVCPPGAVPLPGDAPVPRQWAQCPGLPRPGGSGHGLAAAHSLPRSDRGLWSSCETVGTGLSLLCHPGQRARHRSQLQTGQGGGPPAGPLWGKLRPRVLEESSWQLRALLDATRPPQELQARTASPPHAITPRPSLRAGPPSVSFLPIGPGDPGSPHVLPLARGLQASLCPTCLRLAGGGGRGAQRGCMKTAEVGCRLDAGLGGGPSHRAERLERLSWSGLCLPAQHPDSPFSPQPRPGQLSV